MDIHEAKVVEKLVKELVRESNRLRTLELGVVALAATEELPAKTKMKLLDLVSEEIALSVEAQPHE